MILEEIGNLAVYELLDSGNGERLERFGDFILRRPDPGVLWKPALGEAEWNKADAIYRRGGEAADESATEDIKGKWQIKNPQLPEKWQMEYAIPGYSGHGANENLKFYAKLTPFKHTGVFPEQAANWDFMSGKILCAVKAGRVPQVLNLFGYTGVASVLAAKLGAQVTHVDASKPSLSWAKENMLLSGLPDDAIRWILDDALKFAKRELKRGKKYDAIIMDPPAFGRGSKGEVWKFSEGLPELLDVAAQLLSDDFLFLIVNAYAVSVSALTLNNMLADFGGQRQIDYGELVLKQGSGRLLSTGLFARLH
ncbi:class I SAM-dependent methyltransferase [Patescibacteria group bacterium]|nr:class I SAM-dependent methyltransferase [Patescibacteria group bacterium]